MSVIPLEILNLVRSCSRAHSISLSQLDFQKKRLWGHETQDHGILLDQQGSQGKKLYRSRADLRETYKFSDSPIGPKTVDFEITEIPTGNIIITMEWIRFQYNLNQPPRNLRSGYRFAN